MIWYIKISSYSVHSSYLCFLKLYNYFEDSNYVYLVLEMCHNGEMSRYLKERKRPFSEDEGQKKFFFFFLMFGS